MSSSPGIPNYLSAHEARTVWQPRRAAWYVHIPFCTAICDYCAFAIEPVKGANVQRYLSTLRKEIELYARSNRLANHSFSCGHFGGGTPSVLDGEDLMAIKRLIDSSFEVTSGAEITVEVNPISFTESKAQTYLENGVNRISLGVQSFNDTTLKVIGRPHRARDIQAAVDVIDRLGWRNYSLDLIYGVPGQTLAQLREDLLRSVATGATHLSCFRLEIIPFTALKLREAVDLIPTRLSIEMLNEMDDLVASVLTENGFHHYGAFNFARPGFESVHNEIAFMAPQGEYVGFGNSAYSFVNGHVYCNLAEVADYEEAVLQGRDPIFMAKKVTAFEAMSRFFVLGLKFFSVSRRQFFLQFGIDAEEVFGDVFHRLIDGGLITRDGDNYVLTQTGRHYVNNVSKEFYIGENRGRRQHAQFVPTITPEQISYYSRLSRAARPPVRVE